MSLRKSLSLSAVIYSSAIVAACTGITHAQQAIAMPLMDNDTILMSQAGYTTERAEIIDIDNSDSTVWIRTEDGDYQILPIYNPELLSRARPGSEIFLLKSGDALIDVALSEDDFLIANNYDTEAEAARQRVRTMHEQTTAASSQEQPLAPSSTAQQTDVQPAQSVQPVRGLW